MVNYKGVNMIHCDDLNGIIPFDEPNVPGFRPSITLDDRGSDLIFEAGKKRSVHAV